MAHKNCPHCKRLLKLSECMGLIYRAYDVCKYCQKPFQVKRTTVQINAIIFATLIGLLARKAGFGLFGCILISLFFLCFVQRFIDFWHEIEPADEDVLN